MKRCYCRASACILLLILALIGSRAYATYNILDKIDSGCMQFAQSALQHSTQGIDQETMYSACRSTFKRSVGSIAFDLKTWNVYDAYPAIEKQMPSVLK